jgi:flagellin-like hook-associated protein FlgL
MTSIVASYAYTSRLIDRALSVKGRMDELSTQASTGRIGETFGDLGSSARLSADLRAEMGRRQAYVRAIDGADARVDAMQNVLSRIGEIAQDLSAKALTMMTTGANAVAATAEQARQGLEELASLLNTRVGGVHIFGGSDTGTAPVPAGQDIITTPWFTQMSTEVGMLAAGNGATVLANTLAIAASDAAGTTPFSPFLSTLTPAGGLNEARIGLPDADGSRIVYGVRANSNGAAISPASPATTGSYVRDIMRGLAVLGSLQVPQAAVLPDFTDVVKEVALSLTAAGKTLEQERAALGVAQQRMAATKATHTTLVEAFTAQVSGVEDAPMEETLSRLQQVRTQLESNYQLIAAIRDYTLARFL